MLSPALQRLVIDAAIAAIPDDMQSAPMPPSAAAIRCSNTSQVGFIILEYILPGSARLNKSAPCCVSLKLNEVVW